METDAPRSRSGSRRNRVDERQVLAVALIGGAVALTAGAEPTGIVAVDMVVVFASAAVVTWAAASASWWAVATAAGVAAAIALDPIVTAIGGAAFVTGLWIGIKRRDLGTVRAAVAAVTLNVLLRSELGVVLGLSAAIGVATACVLLVLGIRRRNRTIRKRVWLGLGAVGVASILAMLGFAQGAAAARSELTEGNRLARQGIAALDDGDFADAAAKFRAAAEAFDGADKRLGRPWVLPSRAIPVVAQNRVATVDLAATAASATNEIADALDEVDPEQLRLTDGRLDLVALGAIEQPLRNVEVALADLRGTIDGTDSPWLIDPIQSRVADLDADIDDNEDRLRNAITAVEVAPQMLGADGPRRYFVAFTTPAEARGLGGFMGNYAILTADDGRLRVSRFGRTRDLNGASDPDPPRTVTGPAEWLKRYGEYGFTNGPGGGTGRTPWSNVTVSPDFPSTAAVIAELFPQSGGREIDGVFAVDPYVLSAFLEFTGPISIEATDLELTSDNVVQFLLKDQYEIDDNEGRIDLLEQVADVTIDEMLSGTLPDPTELAKRLGPLAAEGRLVGWAADPGEQALFERISMSGKMPALDGGDGVAVVVNNSGGNKLDTYLEREVSYDATVDEASGDVEGTVTITLLNRTPPLDSPDIVVSNSRDDPRGTNRALVSVYTALPITSASLDGEPLSFRSVTEAGWRTATATILVPPNAESTITIDVRGRLELGEDVYTLSTRPQPLVLPERHDLVVRNADGTTLVSVDETADVPRRVLAMAR